MELNVASEDTNFDGSLPGPLRSVEALHNPFEWYETKRSRAPVHYDSHRAVYDVFSYDHVHTALQDADRFIRPPLSEGDSDSDGPLSYFDTAMVWSDGREHKQAKGQLFEYFSPRVLDGVQESITAVSNSQLKTALEGGPEFDFIEEFAVPVPLRVVMDVVGVPRKDHAQMLSWLKTFRDAMTSEDSAAGSSPDSRLAGAADYFERLVAEREHRPKNDLISQLAGNTDLRPDEIGSNCFDFILAGQGTMSELLANAIYLFGKHNMTGTIDEYDLDVALEEVLRYRSPLQSRARQTAESVTLGGTHIPEGETVILWIGAANRDPKRYDQPEIFLPDRDADHLAFGSGAHNCIGAPLARLQAPIVLQTFFDRIDGFEIRTAEPKSKASKLGFERLSVATSPR